MSKGSVKGSGLLPVEPSHGRASAGFLFEGDALELVNASGEVVEPLIVRVVTGEKEITVYLDADDAETKQVPAILHFDNEEKVPANGDPFGELDKRARERADRGIE